MEGFIKRRSIVICAAACLLFAGCGDNLIELTTEEESIVVTYASGAIAKANKVQARGMTYVMPEIIEEKQMGNPKDAEDSEAGEDAGLPPEGEPEGNGGAQPNDIPKEDAAQSATLTQALGMDGIEAIYNSYYVSDSYEQGAYFALEDAPEGSTYLFLEITLTNKTSNQIECNIFAANPICQIVINGEAKAKARNTMLVNDFSTYMEPIGGGESSETIMIFEIKKEDAGNISSLALKLGIGGNDYNIVLE